MNHERDAMGYSAARAAGRRFPRLRCAVCGRLVTEVEIVSAPSGRSQTLIARCHGAEDRMTLTAEQMQNWTREEQLQWEAIARGEIEGVAFAPRPMIEGGR